MLGGAFTTAAPWPFFGAALDGVGIGAEAAAGTCHVDRGAQT